MLYLFLFSSTVLFLPRQWSAEGRNPRDLSTLRQEVESETKCICYWLFRQTNLQICFLCTSVTTKVSEAHSITKQATLSWKQNLKREHNHTVFQMHYSPIEVKQLVMLICSELQQRHLLGARSSLTEGKQCITDSCYCSCYKYEKWGFFSQSWSAQTWRERPTEQSCPLSKLRESFLTLEGVVFLFPSREQTIAAISLFLEVAQEARFSFLQIISFKSFLHSKFQFIFIQIRTAIVFLSMNAQF